MAEPALVAPNALGTMPEGAEPGTEPVDPAPDAPAALEAAALERAFEGDPRRLRRFLSVIRAALPAGTSIGLRGSAVVGQAYETGAPFDAAGPGTSDLDVVIIGDEVMDLFAPDARLLGGVNTLPLSDAEPWVAPALDRARRTAQAIARRPVSIQAMPRWFLDLRSVVQDQPYVLLDGDR
ncbi:MAG: hypothetical protein AB1627_11660 [Chloroflexota bacterium]